MEYKKINFKEEIVKIAKSMPLPIFVASMVIPGSFTAIGIYLTVKILYSILKKESKNDSKQ